MGSRRREPSWWELFQSSRYPAYLTCIQPPHKSITITGLKPRQVSHVAVDDILDAAADAGHWQPQTFEVKRGSCVFCLPEDATKADKKSVSEPWMVLINEMWFVGSRHVMSPTEKDDKPVIEWEKEQLRNGRLSVNHFSLDVNYLYRLSDLDLANALGRDEQSQKNIKALCKALVTLGVVDNMQSAKTLIDKRGRGTTKACKLLQRCVSWSTHEGKLPQSSSTSKTGRRLAVADSSSAGSDSSEQDDEDEDEDEDEDDADEPIPMDSVMAPFKVYFLGAGQPLPYRRAPVADAVAMGEEPHRVRALTAQQQAALLEQQQQQHQVLPPGFFCNTIFVKQTGELFGLEDWAIGKAGAHLKGEWVQASRQKVKDLLAKTQQELMQQDDSLDADADAGVNGAAAAAAATEGDSAGEAGMDAAYTQDATGTSSQQQQQKQEQEQQEHSQLQQGQQRGQTQAQPQRRTPRKRQRPRRAEPQPEQQPRKSRLRHAAAAAAADDDDDSASDEVEEEVVVVGVARQRGGAVNQADSSGDSSGGVEAVVIEDTSGPSSSSNGEDDDGEDAANKGAAAAAAGPSSRRSAPAAKGAAKQKGGGQQRRSAPVLKSSKGAVLRTPKSKS